MRFERIESAVPPPPQQLVSLVCGPESDVAERCSGTTDSALEHVLSERTGRDDGPPVASGLEERREHPTYVA